MKCFKYPALLPRSLDKIILSKYTSSAEIISAISGIVAVIIFSSEIQAFTDNVGINLDSLPIFEIVLIEGDQIIFLPVRYIDLGIFNQDYLSNTCLFFPRSKRLN
ncbi:hypothetical protein AYI70_g476 [Smittium culicis]|uniref:Uncharacterized protein n=1 Tax=Smittium culicis TaxID=133412 RepID=A0A1R1YGM2_9FUNG|nr:hypothetical protein AYI70_g476 [Smittium culicis]